MYLWLGKGNYLFCDIVVFFRQWMVRSGHREVGVLCVWWVLLPTRVWPKVDVPSNVLGGDVWSLATNIVIMNRGADLRYVICGCLELWSGVLCDRKKCVMKWNAEVVLFKSVNWGVKIYFVGCWNCGVVAWYWAEVESAEVKCRRCTLEGVNCWVEMHVCELLELWCCCMILEWRRVCDEVNCRNYRTVWFEMVCLLKRCEKSMCSREKSLEWLWNIVLNKWTLLWTKYCGVLEEVKSKWYFFPPTYFILNNIRTYSFMFWGTNKLKYTWYSCVFGAYTGIILSLRDNHP